MSESLLDNLLVQLNGTGLAQKDQKLYQFLRRLLGGAEQTQAKVAVIQNSSSGSGSSVVNNNIITQQFLNLLDSESLGEDGFPGPQGIQGNTGSTGATGASGVGIPGFDGSDGEDGLTIPGPAGASGAAGSTGAVGPQGPAIYLANNDYNEELQYLGITSVSAVGAGTVTSVADDGVYTENTPDPIIATGTVSLTTLSKSSIDSAQHTLLGGI